MKCFRIMAVMILIPISSLINIGCDSSSSSGGISNNNITQEQVEMLQAWTDLYLKYGKDGQTSHTLYSKLEKDDTQSTLTVRDSDDNESAVDTASKIADKVCTFAGFPELTPVISLATEVADLFLPDKKSSQEKIEKQIKATLNSINKKLNSIHTEIDSLTETVTKLNDTIIDTLNANQTLQDAEYMSKINIDVNNAIMQVKNNKYYVDDSHTVQKPGGFYENVASKTPGLITIIENISGISSTIDTSQIDIISQDDMTSDNYSIITTDGLSKLSYMYLILDYAYNTQLNSLITTSLINSDNTIENINNYNQNIIQQVLFNLQMLENIYYLGVIAIKERALALEQCPNPDTNSSCPTNLAGMAQWSPPFAGFNSEDTTAEQLEAFTKYWVASVKVFLTMIGTDFFVSDINVENINCQTYKTGLTQIFPTAVETVKNAVFLPEGDWTDQCILYRNQILKNAFPSGNWDGDTPSGNWDGDTLEMKCAGITKTSTEGCIDNYNPGSTVSVTAYVTVHYSTLCPNNESLSANYRPSSTHVTTASAYGYCPNSSFYYNKQADSFADDTDNGYNNNRFQLSTQCSGDCDNCALYISFDPSYFGFNSWFMPADNNAGEQCQIDNNTYGFAANPANPYNYGYYAYFNYSTPTGAVNIGGEVTGNQNEPNIGYISPVLGCWEKDKQCEIIDSVTLCENTDLITLTQSNGWQANVNVTRDGCLPSDNNN